MSKLLENLEGAQKAILLQLSFELQEHENEYTFFFYKQLGCLAPGLKFGKKISNLLSNSRPQIF